MPESKGKRKINKDGVNGYDFDLIVKVGWLTRNPFADLKAPGTLPEERKAYVSAADTDRILAVASTVWRTIIALCRYAGLRCPSEVFRLKWEDVDFGSARMRVPSTKTVHQTGETHRSCSLFANLRPYLMEARQLSNSEAMYVVSGPLGDRIREKMDGPNGSNDANTRTEFLKIIKRAGLNPWPRLFHTLRASCETDLLAHLPMHAVAEWLGHSAAVALKHYARIPEGLYQLAANGRVTSGAVAGWSASAESSQFEAIEREDSAAKSGAVNVQNAVQSGSVGKEQEMTNATESLKNQASRRVLSPSVPPGTNTAMTPRRFELRSQP